MKKTIILLALIIVAAGCKKPYDPPAIQSPKGYLVVEGVINAGSDSTVFKLSRTVSLDSTTGSQPELNAALTVQGDNNSFYPLKELGKGRYGAPGLNLDNTRRYRLQIKAANNAVYLSDFLPVLNSPPIDSVSFDTKGTLTTPGLNVYVNTHDATGKVVYYRWAYSESWIFHPSFASNWVSNGDTVLARNPLTQNITDCWGSDTSSNIVLASSAKLSQDVITQEPVTSVLSSSEKVSDEYSILVTQYALTPDAYNFYTNMKKNTESLGSIFDAEPSEVNGNITCTTNPLEPVIGYVSVGASSERRIFINNRQWPAWATIPFYPDCQLLFKCCYYNFQGANQVDFYINYNIFHTPDPAIPIDAIYAGPSGVILGFTATTRQCADCTLRGSNKRPAFWK